MPFPTGLKDGPDDAEWPPANVPSADLPMLLNQFEVLRSRLAELFPGPLSESNKAAVKQVLMDELEHLEEIGYFGDRG